MTKWIYITTQFEGLHRYEGAPEEVSFLESIHRHVFYVKIHIEVYHNNRDIEFIMFKRLVNNIISSISDMTDVGSCEMICDYLYKQISKEYPKRKIKIDVSEDSENGSVIEYDI